MASYTHAQVATPDNIGSIPYSQVHLNEEPLLDSQAWRFREDIEPPNTTPASQKENKELGLPSAHMLPKQLPNDFSSVPDSTPKIVKYMRNFWLTAWLPIVSFSFLAFCYAVHFKRVKVQVWHVDDPMEHQGNFETL